ncbi:MAG: Icc-related predicted phosphoesterase [Cognaticolwellia sp.]|jgi:Icc-related predicted phosphoesterase
MRILHSSDLHGRYKLLLNGEQDFDLWLDTGDFMDNKGRKCSTGFKIEPALERVYQAKLIRWKKLAQRFAEWLDGRPAILVPGNHDFASFGRYLQALGCPNVHLIEPKGVEVLGLRWAGFREIPWMAGEWVGERKQEDFEDLVRETWAADPDVLVTHAPAFGRLDLNSSRENEGIVSLGQALEEPGGIRTHFHGHTHFSGGKVMEQGGVRTVNGAQGAQVWEL